MSASVSVRAQRSRLPLRRAPHTLFEPLDSRRLLSVSLAFNFQPAVNIPPAGYIADRGKAFDYQLGGQFGWNVNNAANGVDRKTSADDRLDTFAYLDRGASKWEVALPNGQYQVDVTSGDATSLESYYSINVEGVSVLHGAPTTSSRWINGSAVVTVSDGRLSVTSGTSAWNNKINSISIRSVAASPAGAPAKPGWLSAWTETSNTIGLEWENVANETGYLLSSSTDGVNFGSPVTLATNATRYTAWGLNAGANYTFRIVARNASGLSAPTFASARTAGSTTPAPTPAPAPMPTANVPATPGYLWAWTTTANAAALQWPDVSGETGYRIERSSDGVNFATLASLGANATTYNVSGLAGATNHTFRVAAFNAAGSSGSARTSLWIGGAAAPTSPAPTAPAPTPVVSAPATPSFLWSWATGSNSATLQWGNVSNETGYRLEQSSNGSTFTALATVGADTTLYNVSGLAAATNYTFRISAYNAGGDSGSLTSSTTTNSAPATPVATPPPPAAPPPTNNNTGINKLALSGMVQNEVPASIAIPALRELGMTSVRLWYSINSWNDGPNNGDIARAKTFKDAGFTVTLALVAKQQTDYNTARAYFDRVAANSNARYAIDFWEIGNEPNLGGFWNGSLQSYVSNYLRPAYEAIKPYGESVLGGAVSWDVNAVRTLVAAGYNNYCDYVGFHPYGESGDIVIQRARDAKAAFGNKPMIVSEWNVQFVNDRNEMARQVNIAAIGLSNIAYMNYYFALRVSNTHVGQGGVLNMDGSRNNPFWNTVYSWTH